MDARLFTVEGQRLSNLRQQDLPAVARSLVAVLRKRAKLTTGRLQDVSYVQIVSVEQVVVITKDDWGKILPLILSGAIDPVLTATNPQVGYSKPLISYNEPVLDRADAALYKYLLGLLGPLFPDVWPTSNL